MGLFILRGAAGWTLHGRSRLPAAQLPLAAAGALQLHVLGEFCPRHLCSRSTAAPSQVWLALAASFHLPDLCCRKVKGRCWLWRRLSGSSCSQALLGSHKPRCPARAMARRSGALKQAQSPKLLGDASDAGSQGTGNPRRADPRCHMPSLWPQRAAHGMICLEICPHQGIPVLPSQCQHFAPGQCLQPPRCFIPAVDLPAPINPPSTAAHQAPGAPRASLSPSPGCLLSTSPFIHLSAASPRPPQEGPPPGNSLGKC